MGDRPRRSSFTITRIAWPSCQRYSAWSTEIRSVCAAFRAGKLLPTSAISVIRAQASERETGSCTLVDADEHAGQEAIKEPCAGDTDNAAGEDETHGLRDGETQQLRTR